MVFKEVDMMDNTEHNVSVQSKKKMATRIKLIKTEIEKIRPSRNRTIYYDEKVSGFALRVMPSGAKTFFFQARIDGQMIRITIGKYPAMNPAVARKIAEKYQGMVMLGQDPRPEKNEIQADTFGDLMEAYCSLLDCRGKQSAKAVRLDIYKHTRDAFPKIWKKSASTVNLDDCVDIVSKVVAEGKLRQADKIRSYIRTAYSEAINSRGDASMPTAMRKMKISFNPARDMRKIKGSSNAKDRALSVKEFQAYWHHIGGLPEPAKSLLQMHVLTGGQRQAQLARVTLADIDFDSRTMTVMDNKGRRSEPRRHVVPLLPDVLDSIKLITAGPYIFSCDGGKNPIGSNYLWYQAKTICTKMEQAGELENGKFTAGTIRATIETRLTAKPYKVSFDVLAHLLSHGMGGVQARHYQKYDFLDEKREALEKVERLVKRLPEPIASIVEFKAKSA
jgi:integrase